MTTEIGLGVQTDKLPGEYAALARVAEQYGIDVISVYSDLAYQPAIGALLEMAHATERVRLGPACLNPYTLHPYEIAGQIALLDQASHGRAYLGLARGAWLGAIGTGDHKPVQRLDEAIAVVTRLLSGDEGGFEGGIYRLDPGVVLQYSLVRRRVPLMIGSWGRRTLELAGRVADEVKIGGSANPDVVPVARERVEAGVLGSGRDRDAVGIVVGAVSVVDEDGEAARAFARTEVAKYVDVVAELDPTVEFPDGLLDEIRASVAAGDEVGAGRIIPDDLLDCFALSGTPEAVAAQVLRLFAAGASRVELGTPHGLTATGGVDLIGQRVLPLIGRPIPGAQPHTLIDT